MDVHFQINNDISRKISQEIQGNSGSGSLKTDISLEMSLKIDKTGVVFNTSD